MQKHLKLVEKFKARMRCNKHIAIATFYRPGACRSITLEYCRPGTSYGKLYRFDVDETTGAEQMMEHETSALRYFAEE